MSLQLQRLQYEFTEHSLQLAWAIARKILVHRSACCPRFAFLLRSQRLNYRAPLPKAVERFVSTCSFRPQCSPGTISCYSVTRLWRPIQPCPCLMQFHCSRSIFLYVTARRFRGRTVAKKKLTFTVRLTTWRSVMIKTKGNYLVKVIACGIRCCCCWLCSCKAKVALMRDRARMNTCSNQWSCDT